MKQSLKRRAFTMIELLFVIVIMGIVGTFAIEMVRQYYEGIYRTKTITERAAEADYILDQSIRYKFSLDVIYFKEKKSGLK